MSRRGGRRRWAAAGIWLATILSASTWAKAPAGRYVVQSETVVDTWTKLEWQRAVVAGPKTWQAAVAYCDGLTLAGKADWRLPKVRELHGIVDKLEVNPSIDKEAFPSTPVSEFWSASVRAGGSTSAWYVYFNLGSVYSSDKANVFEVRCVR